MHKKLAFFFINQTRTTNEPLYVLYTLNTNFIRFITIYNDEGWRGFRVCEDFLFLNTFLYKIFIMICMSFDEIKLFFFTYFTI